MRSRSVLYAILGAVTLLVLAIVSLVLLRNRGEARFAETCDSIGPGDSLARAQAAFRAIGHPVNGWGGPAGEPPNTFSVFRRSGLSRFQQCDLHVSSARIVTRRRLRESNDFESCADPAIYPRRYWICRIASAVAP
ncbi:MAG: hypothetical protein K8H88_23745 [Sandaracinaceae bacterium]|nr:hypothetical protein [Sandaracinaceae bacterium]